MRVAILHNPKPGLADPGLPDDAYEEFDGPETIEAIAQALNELNLLTVPIIADRKLGSRLEQGRFDFVFNIAEGWGRRCREAVPAAVCELLEIPYTFSDPLTLAATLDKAVARRIVAPEVPSAPAVLVEGEVRPGELDGLAFPVVVKPNDEGSSKGIGADGFCRTAGEAAGRCGFLRRHYGCPVLIEEYLPGPEVTVAVKGNGGSRGVLGMMEVAPAEDGPEPFLYSVEVKRDFRRRVRYHHPPRLSAGKMEQVEQYALTAARLLGVRDLARLDFRFDPRGEARFLECNPLPGLHPQNSDVVILSAAVLEYGDLVRSILVEAAGRCGIALPRQVRAWQKTESLRADRG